MLNSLTCFTKQSLDEVLEDHVLAFEVIVHSKRYTLKYFVINLCLTVMSAASFILTLAMAGMFSVVYPQTSKLELYLIPSLLLFITLIFMLATLYQRKQYMDFSIMAHEREKRRLYL